VGRTWIRDRLGCLRQNASAAKARNDSLPVRSTTPRRNPEKTFDRSSPWTPPLEGAATLASNRKRNTTPPRCVASAAASNANFPYEPPIRGSSVVPRRSPATASPAVPRSALGTASPVVPVLGQVEVGLQRSPTLPRDVRDLRPWLSARHGGLKRAFSALDTDGDGRVDVADLLEDLLRNDADLTPEDAARLGDELDLRWQGTVDLTDFLLSLCEPEEPPSVQVPLVAQQNPRLADCATALEEVQSEIPSGGVASGNALGVSGLSCDTSQQSIMSLETSPVKHERHRAKAGPLPAVVAPPSVEQGVVPTRVTVRWELDNVENVAAITHYVVMVRRLPSVDGSTDEEPSSEHAEDNADPEWEERTDSTKMVHVVAGLSLEATYEFRVRTMNATSETAHSPPSGPYDTGPRPPGPPGQLRYLGPEAVFPHDPVLVFTVPGSGAKAPVEGCRCVVFSKNDRSAKMEVSLRVVCIDNETITAVAGGIQGNAEYQFAVQLRNAGGWGPLGPPSTATFVWRPTAPGRPIARSVEATGLELVWDAIVDHRGKLITAYDVHIRDCDIIASEVQQLVNAVTLPAMTAGERPLAPSVSASVSGLHSGHRYMFRVQAAEGPHPRFASDECEVVELPGAAPEPLPTAPLISRPEATVMGSIEGDTRSRAVRLTWVMEDSEGGAPLFGYRVRSYQISEVALQESEDGSTSDTVPTFPLEAPWVLSVEAKGVSARATGKQERRETHTIAGLRPGKVYCFEVQAVHDFGTSTPSLPSELVRIPAATPMACRGLVAWPLVLGDPDFPEGCTAGAVRLAWQPPDDCGGAVVEAFHLTITPSAGSGDGVGKTRRIAVPAEGHSLHWIRHVVSDLEPGSDYAFGVRCGNSAGAGEECPEWVMRLPADSSEAEVGVRICCQDADDGREGLVKEEKTEGGAENGDEPDEEPRVRGVNDTFAGCV